MKFIYSFSILGAFLLPLLAAADPCDLDEATLAKNKSMAMGLAQKIPMEDVIVGENKAQLWTAKQGGTAFTSWLLGEFNRDSILRDQIADEIQSLGESGRRPDGYVSYHSREGKLCEFKTIGAKELKVHLSPKNSNDEGTLTAFVRIAHGYHHGFYVEEYQFQADVSVATRVNYGTTQYFMGSPSLPVLKGKRTIECDLPLEPSSPKECKDLQ